MSLASKIQAIVLAKSPNATFKLSSYFKANVDSFPLDKISVGKPYVVLSNELEETDTIKPNINIDAEQKVVMWFLANSSIYQQDLDQNDNLIEPMKDLARQVAMQIYRDLDVEGDSNRFVIRPKFKIFNAILSGVELEYRVKENIVVNACPNPAP